MRRNKAELNDSDQTIDQIEDKIKKKRYIKKLNQRKKTIKNSLKVLVLLLFAGALYLFDQSSVSRIQTIVVHGNQKISEAEIIAGLDLHSNQRVYLTLPYFLEKRANNIVGVASIDAKVYYTKGLVSLNVSEFTAVGYVISPQTAIIFANGQRKELDQNSLSLIAGLPLIVGFDDDSLTELVAALATIDLASLSSISEIHPVESDYNELDLKLIMNNQYYVFSNVETLMLIDNYATIISQADEDKRCIYLLEYGPTEETQVALASPCE